MGNKIYERSKNEEITLKGEYIFVVILTIFETLASLILIRLTTRKLKLIRDPEINKYLNTLTIRAFKYIRIHLMLQLLKAIV